MNKQQFKTYGIALGIMAILLVVIGITHTLGYRITLGGLVKASTLEILVEKSGSKVFINNERQATTNKDGELIVLKNVTPGTHEILISKEGFWPWAKQITLEKDRTLRVGSFTLRSNVEGVIIPKEDPEYGPIMSRIASTSVPTETVKTLSEDGSAAAWVEGNRIIVEKKGEASGIEVFSSAEPILNLEFYKDRTDVLLFSASNGIFAIETEKSGVQNFQPLYKGVSVGLKFFVDRTDGVLYAKDGDMLLIINI